MVDKNATKSNWVLRHLVIVMIIKMMALVAIWWFFVKDKKVEVNSEAAASHLLQERKLNAPLAD